jgi:alpha-L-fucosidase
LPDLVEALRRIDAVVAAGPFQATWESLRGYRVPSWYEDAKFGIFIHWGVYSVPAFANEWYPRNMYRQGTREFQHHVETYGPQDRFGYKDFIPQFTAERFDADAWARLFREAGAQFVVPVAEHHDGFAMYDCSFTEWNAVRMGPKRDVVGELAEAVRRQWMVFGVSSHRAEHWWFFHPGTQIPSDVQDPRYAGLYGPAQPESLPPNEAFLDDWLARTCELVDRYQPQIVWFDWWIERPAFEAHVRRFAAYYYNRAASWGRGVAINYKYGPFPEGTAVLDVERGQLDDIRPLFWQTDTSVSENSWGYVRDHRYKTAGKLIADLADIVSKNGALLLNVGPRPDGTLPEPEEALLRAIGRWLGTYGEAIYGTRPWKVYGEGPTRVARGAFTDTKHQAFTGEDLRFTRRGESLYVIGLAWPDGDRVVVRSLAEGLTLYPQAVGRVELLGHPEPLAWQRDRGGLTVELPAARRQDLPYALKVTPAR